MGDDQGFEPTAEAVEVDSGEYRQGRARLLDVCENRPMACVVGKESTVGRKGFSCAASLLTGRLHSTLVESVHSVLRPDLYRVSVESATGDMKGESMLIIRESQRAEQDLPGRHLRWIVEKGRGERHDFSMNVVRIDAGQTVHPAHSHPNGEELVYVLSGVGRVYVDSEVGAVEQGDSVVFPRGSIHMVRNPGNEELKLLCFFSPAADGSDYRFHPEVTFPDETEK